MTYCSLFSGFNEERTCPPVREGSTGPWTVDDSPFVDMMMMARRGRSSGNQTPKSTSQDCQRSSVACSARRKDILEQRSRRGYLEDQTFFIESTRLNLSVGNHAAIVDISTKACLSALSLPSSTVYVDRKRIFPS